MGGGEGRGGSVSLSAVRVMAARVTSLIGSKSEPNSSLLGDVVQITGRNLFTAISFDATVSLCDRVTGNLWQSDKQFVLHLNLFALGFGYLPSLELSIIITGCQ